MFLSDERGWKEGFGEFLFGEGGSDRVGDFFFCKGSIPNLVLNECRMVKKLKTFIPMLWLHEYPIQGFLLLDEEVNVIHTQRR